MWRQPRGGVGARVAQQGLDLGSALDRDGVGPGLAEPVVVALAEQVFAAERQVADDALVVDDQRHVGGRSDELSGHVGREVAKRSRRRFELSHDADFPADWRIASSVFFHRDRCPRAQRASAGESVLSHLSADQALGQRRRFATVYCHAVSADPADELGMKPEQRPPHDHHQLPIASGMPDGGDACRELRQANLGARARSRPRRTTRP